MPDVDASLEAVVAEDGNGRLPRRSTTYEYFASSILFFACFVFICWTQKDALVELINKCVLADNLPKMKAVVFSVRNGTMTCVVLRLVRTALGKEHRADTIQENSKLMTILACISFALCHLQVRLHAHLRLYPK